MASIANIDGIRRVSTWFSGTICICKMRQYAMARYGCRHAVLSNFVPSGNTINTSDFIILDSMDGCGISSGSVAWKRSVGRVSNSACGNEFTLQDSRRG